MTREQLTLTLNPGDADERQYTVDIIDTVELSSTKEAFSIAPPGLASSENILLGVSGMQADITVTWNIHDDGTDKANGTHTSQVVTVEEQLTYLEDVMHAPDFAATWELDHATGAAFNDDDVFVESIDPTVISNQSPKWKPATMRLRRGGSIG